MGVLPLHRLLPYPFCPPTGWLPRCKALASGRDGATPRLQTVQIEVSGEAEVPFGPRYSSDTCLDSLEPWGKNCPWATKAASCFRAGLPHPARWHKNARATPITGKPIAGPMRGPGPSSDFCPIVKRPRLASPLASPDYLARLASPRLASPRLASPLASPDYLAPLALSDCPRASARLASSPYSLALSPCPIVKPPRLASSPDSLVRLSSGLASPRFSPRPIPLPSRPARLSNGLASPRPSPDSFALSPCPIVERPCRPFSLSPLPFRLVGLQAASRPCFRAGLPGRTRRE